MECQTTVMDMDVFQTRLGVMLQWVTLNPKWCLCGVSFGCNAEHYRLLLSHSTSASVCLHSGTCLARRVWTSATRRTSLSPLTGRRFTFAWRRGWDGKLRCRIIIIGCRIIIVLSLFLSVYVCPPPPTPKSVSVLRGRMHRGRLPQRDGGSGSATALWCPQPSHLSGGGRPADEHLETLEITKENYGISYPRMWSMCVDLMWKPVLVQHCMSFTWLLILLLIFISNFSIYGCFFKGGSVGVDALLCFAEWQSWTAQNVCVHCKFEKNVFWFLFCLNQKRVYVLHSCLS